jgi:hypothetical protein
MAAWSQILQIVGNSTLFYYNLTSMKALGLSSYGISNLLQDLEMWENFESDLPVCVNST